MPLAVTRGISAYPLARSSSALRKRPPWDARFVESSTAGPLLRPALFSLRRWQLVMMTGVNAKRVTESASRYMDRWVRIIVGYPAMSTQSFLTMMECAATAALNGDMDFSSFADLLVLSVRRAAPPLDPTVDGRARAFAAAITREAWCRESSELRQMRLLREFQAWLKDAIAG